MRLIFLYIQLEDIHQAVEAMKTRYLNDRRCWGGWDDPFDEADTRESAKQEATVRMVHPTLHLSLQSQPTTSVTASVMASQLHQNSFPIRGTLPSSCPTLPPPLRLPTSSTQPSSDAVTNKLLNPFSISGNTGGILSPQYTSHRCACSWIAAVAS